MRLIVLLSLLLGGVSVFAHCPRLIDSDSIYINRVEVSQAYYAQLNGKSHHYFITHPDSFYFYLQILLPDITTLKQKNFILEIRSVGDSSIVIHRINTNGYNWVSFFEPYGEDAYLSGPEIEFTAAAGSYEIVVYNNKNQGKYALAVGKKESWPINEIWNALVVMPKIKKEFFEKAAISAYVNRIGLFLLLVLSVIIVLLVIMITRILK